MAEPGKFLTPEPLHQWHKMFWDHDAKWCCNALGKEEINFRSSILHPYNGYHQFREGISQLKQVTGREHRNFQCYLVGAIAGGAPKEFIITIRALMDFCYLGQTPVANKLINEKMEDALSLFHQHKDPIIDLGACQGKGGRVIDNWHIPKLEIMQSVVPNIRVNGVVMQWNTDHTECAHITEIKNPGRGVTTKTMNHKWLAIWIAQINVTTLT